MPEINLKRGEAKTLTFTVKDRTSGAVVDLSNATMTFSVKTSKAVGTTTIQRTGTAFGTADASKGIVTLNLTESDTDINPLTYVSELKTRFGSTISDKSADIDFIIGTAVN